MTTASVKQEFQAGSEAVASLRMGKHLPVLDGIRGIAVLLVLMHHFGLGGTPDYHRWAGKLFFSVVSVGWAGVDLFFVLSGFLITGILIDAKGASHYFRDFYARRVLRIFPLYYGVLLTVFVLLPLCGFGTLGQPARQLWAWFYGSNTAGFFSGNWRATNWYGATNYFQLDFWHFWSLAIEEHFYLLWPLLVFLLSRRSLMFLCGVLVLVALACRIALLSAGCQPLGLPYQWTPCRIDALAVGAFLALAVRRPAGAQALIQPARWTLVFSGLGLLLLCWSNGLRRESVVTTAAGFTLLALFLGGILLLSVTAGQGHPAVRPIDNPVTRFFGRYSYGIYIYQGLLFFPLSKYWFSVETLDRWTGHYLISVMLHFVAATAAVVGISWLSWHLYEKQFLKLKRYFAYGGSQRPKGDRETARVAVGSHG